MAWYRWRYKFVACKSEETYGTNSAPSYAADLVYCENVSLQPMVAQSIDRRVDIGRASHTITHMVGRHVVLTMDVPMTAAGVAGTPPAYGHLLQACGLAETVLANQTVTYTTIEEDPPSLTLNVRIDGMSQVIRGCRGTFTIRGQVPGPLYANFVITGLFEGPAAATVPVGMPTVSRGKVYMLSKPLTDVVLAATGLSATAFEIALGNTVQYTETTAVQEVRVVARDPTGSITAEADLSAADHFASAVAETDQTLSITHGTGADRINVSSASTRISEIGLEEISGATGLRLALTMRSTTTAPDLSITFGTGA